MTDVALVTGAAGALGAEVARTLSARGDRLVLVDGPGAKARLEQLAATLPSACVVAGDITSDATWNEAMPRIERELGAPPSLAALVAGAWRGGAPLHEEKDDAVWTTMMTANLETVHRSLVRLLPAMVARQARERRGRRLARRGATVDERGRGGVRGRRSRRSSRSRRPWRPRCSSTACASTRSCRARWTRPRTARRCRRPIRARWVSLGSAAGVVAFLLSDEARDISGAALPGLRARPRAQPMRERPVASGA